MIRFGEKFKSVNFWPKTAPVCPILGKTRTYLKKELARFLVFTES